MRCGAGHSNSTCLTLRDPSNATVGGTPESLGKPQYVCQPGASLISTPARKVPAAACLPATRRMPLWADPSQAVTSSAARDGAAPKTSAPAQIAAARPLPSILFAMECVYG